MSYQLVNAYETLINFSLKTGLRKIAPTCWDVGVIIGFLKTLFKVRFYIV
jgi:hypothetical protein